jgi:UDP-3-O-[3-hydroxymyristoyl] glucosamine N-acyltransferase
MRLAELAKKVGASVDGDGSIEISGLAPIEEAGPGELTFVANPRYAQYLATTKASAVIVGADVEVGRLTALRAPEPYGAFVAALALFDARPRPEPGVHPTAVVADSAKVGAGAYIGPYAVIGDDTTIGRDASIHPHVVIYAQVTIGDRFLAHAGAVVRECSRLGNDVTLQPGCVIGGDGFGFLPVGDVPPAIPQIGSVEIGDCVDIGANTTVDRAAVGNTRLAKGVKLDNLVQIAHGCRVGEASMLAAQVGLAGSTIVGRGVLAGGQAGFTGHLEVGDGVRLNAKAAVTADVPGGRTVAGYPAIEVGLWRRISVALLRLPELLKRVRALEIRLVERGDDEKPRERE